MVFYRGITTNAPSGGVNLEKLEFNLDNFEVKLKPLLTGICGTDRGIVNGALPFAYNPDGYSRLVIGHESLCVVEDARDNDFGIRNGDYVVPMVRRPGKCINCLAGRSDNCSDGDKHEAGITGLHGFMREEFGDSAQYLVKVPDPSIGDVAVLTEPLKNVCKAFEMFDVVSRKSIYTDEAGSYHKKKSLIVGTGSEAFLYALKSMDYGFGTYVTNRHDLDETKNELMGRTGINFYNYNKEDPLKGGGLDLVIDTSGDPGTIFRFMRRMNQNGILILFGTNGKAQAAQVDGMDIDYIIERNITILGSVDGSRIHYEKAIQDITRWKHQYHGALETMITEKVTPEHTEIFTKKPSDEIKTVIDWS